MSDKEIFNIIEDMVILTDTREQKNQHVLDYLTNNGIKHIVEKLDTADYTFILPSYPELNLDRQILVERKGSINEIAGNFSKDRERFIREFERVGDKKIHMVLEGTTWKKIMAKSYRSDIHPNSFMASIFTINIRYNCPIWFTTELDTPIVIYNIMKYELREKLKNIN